MCIGWQGASRWAGGVVDGLIGLIRGECIKDFIFVPGAAFTRYQTQLLRRAFPSVLSDQLVSYGPCQFPTLGFVVERVSAVICMAVNSRTLSNLRP